MTKESFDDLSSLPSFKSNTMSSRYSSGSSSSDSNMVPPPPSEYDDSDSTTSRSSGRVSIDGQEAASEENKENSNSCSENESSPINAMSIPKPQKTNLSNVGLGTEVSDNSYASPTSGMVTRVIQEDSYELSNDNEFIDDLFDLISIPMDVSQLKSVDSHTGYQCDMNLSIRSCIKDENQRSPAAFSDSYHDYIRDPPTDSSSCDSQEIETDRCLSHDGLLSLVEVGKVFALRCAFDHWNRVDMDKKRVLALERYSIAFKTMECVSNHVKIRRALFKILEKKSKCEAVNILSNLCLRVLLRVAFKSWVDKTAQYIAVNNYIAESRIKMIRRCILQWKVFTIGVITRRKMCFLMMLFNRWRLYAEERIDERQQEYDALMHWAKHLMAKTFHGLRMISRMSRIDRRSRYSFSSFSNTPMKTWTGSSHRSLSIYRSPQRSRLSCGKPDPMSRFTSTQSGSSFSLGKTAMGYGSTNPYQDPRQSKNGSYGASAVPTTINFNGESIVGGVLSPPRQWLSKVRRSPPCSSLLRSFTEKTKNATNPTLTCHYSLPKASVSVRDTRHNRVTKALFKDRYDIANLLDTMVSIIEQRSVHVNDCVANTFAYYQPTLYAGCIEELYNRL